MVEICLKIGKIKLEQIWGETNGFWVVSLGHGSMIATGDEEEGEGRQGKGLSGDQLQERRGLNKGWLCKDKVSLTLTIH